MTRAEALQKLKSHELDLRAMGIKRLSFFGSTARDEAGPESDLDLAAVIDYDAVNNAGMFAFFGLPGDIGQLLGIKVDLVTEPARKPWLQAEIDRDRVRVF